VTTTEATTSFTTEDWARKVRSLLDRAQATDNEAESDLFNAKAVALMEKHQLDEIMINDAAQVEKDELVKETFIFTGRFAEANLMMSYYIATAFDMRGTKGTRDWPEKSSVLTLYGFASDMEKFKTLNASLSIQAVRAQKQWERRIGLRTSSMEQWDKFKQRRAFITGFGDGVREKLLQAKRLAKADFIRDRAAASGTTVEDESTGVALVLRNRKETVDDWYDEIMGGRSGRRSRTFSNRGAHSAVYAGRQAGAKADTGQGGLNSRANRRELPR
jgi:hypothetical protein